MIRIELTVDTSAFEAQARDHVDGEVLPRLVDAVNEVAEAARLDLVDAMVGAFDRPTPFTIAGAAVLPARISTTRDPAALVFIQDRQAAFLDLQIYGGVRRAGAYATTRLGPLVPGKDGPKDAYGNLPRNFVQRTLRDAAVAWVTLKPGEPPALVWRTKAGLEILALIVREAHYDKPRLPFYDLVERAVAREWPKAAARALTRRSGGD